MENSGIDIEAILNGDTSGRHDIFKEYLKNKENELLQLGEGAQASQQDMIQSSN